MQSAAMRRARRIPDGTLEGRFRQTGDIVHRTDIPIDRHRPVHNLREQRRPGAAFAAAVLAGALALPVVIAPASAAPREKPAARSQSRESVRDPRVWSVVKADDTYVLRYGLPRAADPAFAAACQPQARLIQIMVEVAATRIRSGDGVALSLSAGRRKLELAGSAFRAATEGRVVVEAAVTLEARVLDLFSDGDTLTVRVPGATEAYPLAGARQRLADFRRVCLVSG